MYERHRERERERERELSQSHFVLASTVFPLSWLEAKKEGQTLVGFMPKLGVHRFEMGAQAPVTPEDQLPDPGLRIPPSIGHVCHEGRPGSNGVPALQVLALLCHKN